MRYYRNFYLNIISCLWDKNFEINCKENCTAAYRILPNELSLYRLMKVSLPRKCPNSRNFEKFQMRNPINVWHRQCMCDKDHAHHSGKCSSEFETSYSPERKEIVYCEQCYQQEVS